MAVSPARQLNAVSEGIALGLNILGRNEFEFNKLRVDLAFEHAWRDWPYRDRFSRVSTSLAKGTDAVWVLTHADEKKRTLVFYWEWLNGPIRIVARRHDWDPHDPDEVAFALRVIDGDVPLDGWVSLAREFITNLDR